METIKNKSPIISITIFLCLIILFSVRLDVFAETAPPEIVEAAEKGLQPFLQHIPPGALENYGFASDDPLPEARVDIPFKVHTITPLALRNYAPGDRVSSLLSPIAMWYFPIVVNGRFRAVLTVSRLDGAWRAVALGQAPLARELEKVMTQWPRSKGYDPVLVMVFQAKSYLFTVPQHDDYGLTPFIFGEDRIEKMYETGEKYATSPELPDVIEGLRTAVEENIRYGR